MRNLKKFLALVLAMLMVVSAGAAVSADFTDVTEDDVYYDAVNTLAGYGIVTGYEDGSFGADNILERWMYALMFARTFNPDSDMDWTKGISIFPDVDVNYQYPGAINWAFGEGIINGVSATELQFNPTGKIELYQALLMSIRLLGFEDQLNDKLPLDKAVLLLADKLGLTAGLDEIESANEALTRGEAALLLVTTLRTVPADGGLTIEQAYYGAADVKNTTPFVITATSKQSYVGATGALVDDAYVTLQVLEADGTLGDAIHVEFAKLNFAEDVTPDDVIGYTVGLVNFDGEDFVDAVPGTADAVNSLDVTVSGNKVTIDGRVYYLVEEYSENTIRNEIIVKDAAGIVSDKTLTSVSDLFFNGDGNVVNATGTVLAYKMTDITGSNGSTLYKLAKDVNASAFLLYTAEELLNVTDVAKEYNETNKVDGYATVLDTLSGGFNLTLFDDNGDEKYDRAIKDNIYMSVVDNKNSNGTEKMTGPMNGDKVTFVPERPATGSVIVYTYNPQTCVVDVIDTLELLDGTITKINLNADANKRTVTIDDGVEVIDYKFGSANDGAPIGASLQAHNASELDGGDIDKIATKPALAYVPQSKLDSVAAVNSPVKFYAYNNYLVFAETYDVEESFNIAAIKEVTDYEPGEAVIADIYVDGKLVEDAVISEVWYNDKTIDLDTVKTSTATQAIANYYMGYNDGKIYKAIVLDDGSYRLGVELDENNASTNTFKYAPLTAYAAGVYNTVEFYDGVSYNKDNGATRAEALRTNDNTVFYLVSKTGDLNVITTSGKDYVIKTDGTTKIFADKLGYTGSKKGIATKVFVFDYVEVEGFGLAAKLNGYVYIPSASGILDKFELNTPENFGLSNTYEKNLIKYPNVAVDLQTGAKVTIYSEAALTSGKAYIVDENYVVVDTDGIDLTDTTVFATVNAKSSDLVLDDEEYKYFTGNAAAAVTTADEVTKIVLNPVGTMDPQTITSGNVKHLSTTAKAIYYLKADDNNHAANLKDGSFVAIVAAEQAADPTTETMTVAIKASDLAKQMIGNTTIKLYVELKSGDTVYTVDSVAQQAIVNLVNGEASVSFTVTKNHVPSTNYTVSVQPIDKLPAGVSVATVDYTNDWKADTKTQTVDVIYSYTAPTTNP